MILLIDNYDSFVHNLARYVRELSWDAVVHRNDFIPLPGQRGGDLPDQDRQTVPFVVHGNHH